MAWSFAVDPRTATVPLQRVPAAAATQAAPVVAGPPRRFVSFVIQVQMQHRMSQRSLGLLLKAADCSLLISIPFDVPLHHNYRAGQAPDGTAAGLQGAKGAPSEGGGCLQQARCDSPS